MANGKVHFLEYTEIKSLFLKLEDSISRSNPQGSTFVGTGSGAPEVPELPSALGYSRATRPHGDINSGDWSSRLGVGRRANIPASLKTLFTNPKKYAGRI
jgi:hypothetical protein